MEKIKNLLNPGSKHDNEVMYGSGLNEDPVHDRALASSSGDGSHFGSSRTAGEAGGATATGHHSAVNPDPFSSHNLGTTDLNEPSSTHGTSHTSRTLDDAATTASIKSGVPGNPQSTSLTGSTGSEEPLPHEPTGSSLKGTSDKHAAGPHASSLANRADPRVDSDLDGSKGLGGGATSTGSGLTGGSLPDRSVEGSGHGNDSSNLGRDTAIGAGAVGAGALGASTGTHHHRDDQQGSDARDSSRSFPLGGHSATKSSFEPQGSGYGNELTSDSSNLGRDTAIGAGALGAGALGASTATHHRDRPQDTDVTDSSRPPPLGGYSTNRPSSEFPSGSTGMTGSTPAGPHSSNLANKADPRVDSDLDGSNTVGNTGSTSTGYGSGTGPTTGSAHQGSLEQDKGPVGGTGAAVGSGLADYGLETSKHGHGGHGHTYEGDPCERGETAVPGPHFIAGPHATDTANRLDPHVSSSGLGEPNATTHGDHHGGDTALVGGSGAAGTSAFGLSHDASNSVTDSQTDPTGHGKHHYGRDAGFAATGGAAAFEAEKHLGKDISSSKTSGIPPTAHGASYDTRTPTGTGNDAQSGTGHHYGRDAALAGSGGVAAYEAGKHLGKDTSNQSSGIPESSHGASHDITRATPGAGNDSQSGAGQHYGRDAGLAGLGAGSAAAYEAERHKDRGEPTTTAGSTYPSSGYDDRDRTAESHTGRDTALAGGAAAGLGAGAEAEFSKKEAEKLEKQYHKELEKEQKTIHKDQLKHEKALEEEEKKHEKALEKEEKKKEKALAKDDKKHDDGKKHGGLLGLFHRDKPDKDLREEELERQGAGSHHGAETAAGVGAVGAAGAGVVDHEKHDRNRLHKDPPAGHYQPAGYGEEPKHGYAAEVTGGTGTTALAQGENLPGGPHLTSIGNKMDPNVPEPGNSLDPSGTDGQTTIEPHTGLPIDLTKGTGAGGTDASPVPGYHSHGGGVTGGTTGEYGSGHTGTSTGTTGEYGSGHAGTSTGTAL